MIQELGTLLGTKLFALFCYVAWYKPCARGPAPQEELDFAKIILAPYVARSAARAEGLPHSRTYYFPQTTLVDQTAELNARK